MARSGGAGERVAAFPGPGAGPALEARPDEVVVTYLEMTEDPAHATAAPTHVKLALLRVETPPTHFFRYLYDLVGAPYNWWLRKTMTDAALAAHFADPGVRLYTLYVGGAPGGFFELDFRAEGACELAYFGLAPEVQGLGLGEWLLASAISLAWAEPIERLRVNTCTDDHARALPLYQRMGFRPYRQEVTPRGPE